MTLDGHRLLGWSSSIHLERLVSVGSCWMDFRSLPFFSRYPRGVQVDSSQMTYLAIQCFRLFFRKNSVVNFAECFGSCMNFAPLPNFFREDSIYTFQCFCIHLGIPDSVNECQLSNTACTHTAQYKNTATPMFHCWYHTIFMAIFANCST